MFESIKPLADRWYVFLPLLCAVAVLYVCERRIPKKAVKTVCNVLNLCVHTALLVFCLVFDTGMDNCLLLVLCAVLIGLATEGGKKHGI